MSLGLICAFSH